LFCKRAIQKEKKIFREAFNEVKEEEARVLVDGEDTEAEKIVTAMVLILENIERQVIKRIEEELLPAWFILHEIDVVMAQKIDKYTSGEEKNALTKQTEDLINIRAILKKLVSRLKGIDVSFKQFKQIEGTEKHGLFLKGYLLPSEVEDLVVNENVGFMVTTESGSTAHWVLVAKDFNVPVFFATRKAGDRASLTMDEVLKNASVGNPVIFDGPRGILIINPDEQMMGGYEKKIYRTRSP